MAAVDFPSSPVTGQTFGNWVWDGMKWTAHSSATTSALVVLISDTAPPTPQVGNLWFDSVKLGLYVWYDDGTSQQWVASNQL